MKCPQCKLDYPADMVRDLVIGSVTVPACPLCARIQRNRALGVPADTPFHGPQAAALHARAVAHLKATDQVHPGG